MDKYREIVEHMAATKMDNEFGNKNMQHAAIVLTTMLRNATESFKIFSGEFHSDVTHDAEFLAALEEYLKSGKTFKLLLATIPEEDKRSDALKMVIKYAGTHEKTVFYTKAEESFITSPLELFNGKIPYHFSVADKTAFRLEIDAQEYKAICNFNDQKIAKDLSDLFDDNFGI